MCQPLVQEEALRHAVPQQPAGMSIGLCGFTLLALLHDRLTDEVMAYVHPCLSDHCCVACVKFDKYYMHMHLQLLLL